MADSGVECHDKIKTISKSIGRFEDKRYPIHYKRRRFSNGLKQYTIDRDTWLARHNQPLSPMRSPRALEGRADMLWRKFMHTPTPQQVDEWRTEVIDTGDEGHWFMAIKKK